MKTSSKLEISHNPTVIYRQSLVDKQIAPINWNDKDIPVTQYIHGNYLDYQYLSNDRSVLKKLTRYYKLKKEKRRNAYHYIREMLEWVLCNLYVESERSLEELPEEITYKKFQKLIYTIEPTLQEHYILEIQMIEDYYKRYGFWKK